jgi:hypothetical protein
MSKTTLAFMIATVLFLIAFTLASPKTTIRDYFGAASDVLHANDQGPAMSMRLGSGKVWTPQCSQIKDALLSGRATGEQKEILTLTLRRNCL